MLKFAGAVVGVVFIYWAFLFLMQRRLMFPAPLAPGASIAPPRGAQQIWLDGSAGTTEAWLLPPNPPTGHAWPLLIFAHGNGELIDDWPDAFDEPRRWGMAIMLVEYPGYGRSGGSPSEATINATFRAAYDWAVVHATTDSSRIVGYGRSVGGGAIAGLSRDRTMQAMILESSFTSTKPFARRLGAPSFLIRDVVDNAAAVRQYGGALLVTHGTLDEVVPVEHGRNLARIAGVQLHEFPCGHNDCGRSWPLVKRFLEQSDILANNPR